VNDTFQPASTSSPQLSSSPRERNQKVKRKNSKVQHMLAHIPSLTLNWDFKMMPVVDRKRPKHGTNANLRIDLVLFPVTQKF